MWELSFQFADGYSVHCTVFLARDLDGEPVETVEATPQWTPIAQIPYEEMWEDDQYWLPQMLAGERFEAWFEFDGDRMLSKRVDVRR
jgi:8-oxo-dGTP diphosphatase